MLSFHDSHLHIAPDSPWQMWHELGLQGAVAAAVVPADWENLLTICEASQGVLTPALGIHPWHAHEVGDNDLRQLREMLIAQPQAWLGEIGVDYATYVTVPHDIQERVFLQQANFAMELGRPAILHLRGHWERILEVLQAVNGLRGIIHGFSGSREVAEQLLRTTQLGISIGPGILRETAKKVRNATVAIPLERLFVDSDYPYQAETPLTCGNTLRTIAQLRSIPPETLATAIHHNWQVLHRI